MRWWEEKSQAYFSESSLAYRIFCMIVSVAAPTRPTDRLTKSRLRKSWASLCTAAPNGCEQRQLCMRTLGGLLLKGIVHEGFMCMSCVSAKDADLPTCALAHLLSEMWQKRAKCDAPGNPACQNAERCREFAARSPYPAYCSKRWTIMITHPTNQIQQNDTCNERGTLHRSASSRHRKMMSTNFTFPLSMKSTSLPGAATITSAPLSTARSWA